MELISGSRICQECHNRPRVSRPRHGVITRPLTQPTTRIGASRTTSRPCYRQTARIEPAAATGRSVPLDPTEEQEEVLDRDRAVSTLNTTGTRREAPLLSIGTQNQVPVNRRTTTMDGASPPPPFPGATTQASTPSITITAVVVRPAGLSRAVRQAGARHRRVNQWVAAEVRGAVSPAVPGSSGTTRAQPSVDEWMMGAPAFGANLVDQEVGRTCRYPTSAPVVHHLDNRHVCRRVAPEASNRWMARHGASRTLVVAGAIQTRSILTLGTLPTRTVEAPAVTAVV